MSRAAIATAVLAVGCNFTRGELDDARPIDTPSGGFCYGASSLARVCVPQPPSTAVTINANTLLDTDSGNSTTTIECAPLVAGSSNVCAIIGTTVTINSGITLQANSAPGGRPLVIVALDTITISGILDVGSHQTGGMNPPIIGPSADTSEGCSFTGTPSTITGGGGAGGSFGSTGGDGGNSNGANDRGTHGPTVVPTRLRGGCPGQLGGGGSSTSSGLPGHGGGAVQLIAPTIVTTGLINASGSGGYGALPNDNGGGGGGAGGMIVFEASAIQHGGITWANGSGGGGGSTFSNGGNGTDALASGNAAGGAGAGTAGSGGRGNVLAGAGMAGSGGNNGTSGGGGGGGGAGIIRVIGGATGLSGGTVSPPPT